MNTLIKDNEILEWKVLNGNFNKKTVEFFNVFNNWLFTNAVIRAVKKYKRSVYTIEELKDEIEKCARWQFWSRIEYEIGVCDWISCDDADAKRFDVCDQLICNINQFTEFCLMHYKALYKMYCK